MRQLFIALAIVLAGCQPNPTRIQWTLYADDARIDASDGNGQPWCDQLEVRVTAWLPRGHRHSTPAATGLTPSWHAPLVTAKERDFARGLSLEVLGQCAAAPPFSLGALAIRPARKMIEKRGVQLLRFGSVAVLRMHFAPRGAKRSPPPVYNGYAPGDSSGEVVAVYAPPCDNGGDPYDNCGAWPSDPGPSVDTGGGSDPTATDPGTSDPGTADPGTSDPGTTDPGSTDPGTTDPGTSDPGTTDPGSTDPGTTDPGTSDPGTPASRVRQRPRSTVQKK